MSIEIVSPDVADEITMLREANFRWEQIVKRERAARLRNLQRALKFRKARRQIMLNDIKVPENWEQNANAFIDKGLENAANKTANETAFNAHQKMLLDSVIRELKEADGGGRVSAVKYYRDWVKFNKGVLPDLKESIAYVDQVK